MAPSPRTPRTALSTRQRARQSETTSMSRRARTNSIVAATEPPLKKRRYHPGGSGGGGRFSEKESDDHIDALATTSSRVRTRPGLAASNADSPSLLPPRRERSTRIRTSTRVDQDDEMQISSAAAVAAVVQSEGYKPREERGWEEFHPNLDIEATFMLFHADDVDGIAKPVPETPFGKPTFGDTHDTGSPCKGMAHTPNPKATGVIFNSQPPATTTPTRRRAGRSVYATRADTTLPPNTPTPLPIFGQNNKEKLDLKLPSYRKTDRIALFESKTFGQARYVDKAMMNIGYQESDNYIRPERRLIKATDANVDEDQDISTIFKADGDTAPQAAGNGNHFSRVEYDMDEQDDMWLEGYNQYRASQGWNLVTREVFELTITKIEKEWHALEKRIPKPNPKPPQTHRPRSSSAAAVNGEPQPGEEQDSKCAICDDGDCENTNAIVFCDGCDLAVHQECYGVPFIPEGQWLCRKCQLIGRGVPTCIFCPNSDGAFKQTNSSKWAHLLCAVWIPEVTLGNHTFMEPVMDVDKVSKSRWKLTCYICNQQMGACIQCGNKACYQAFHVTCARRARLFLRMKNSSGALDVLEGSTNLKALCDKHCPSEYAQENDVVQATKSAKKYYKKTMRDRLWANNQASAMAMAATHRHAITDHPPDESQMTGAKLSAVLGDKKGQQGKSIWKLPSGAPVIPQAVFDIVESSLQRFTFLKRKEFVSDACRYWTLKREMRRGAALLKRLQLQMETFSSMELTRRNFAAMGVTGKARLDRRIEFAEVLLKDLEKLKDLSDEIVAREQTKLEAAEMERDFVDTCYFPINKLLVPVVEKAIALDKNVFYDGLQTLSSRLDQRYYATTLALAHDLGQVIHSGINTELDTHDGALQSTAHSLAATAKSDFSDYRERRKLGKRILKAVQPQLEAALHLEAEANHRPFKSLKQELEAITEASLEYRPKPVATNGGLDGEKSQDVIMVDSSLAVIAAGGMKQEDVDDKGSHADVPMTDAMTEANNQGTSTDGNIDVDTSDPMAVDNAQDEDDMATASHIQITGGKPSGMSGMNNDLDINTPPGINGYNSMMPASQPAPPTPPHSNSSLERQPTDTLTDGGILWYLQEFDPVGASAVLEEQEEAHTVRNQSEELTEIDDDELKGLGVEISESITASPAEGAPAVEGANHASPTKKASRPKKRKATTYRGRR
ncbi:PHD-finger domain-containing protein [Xylariaceae sp. FL0594]|nr:PHD-finger domain-containing protein [Xylariaceae sp. FL0594]